MTLHRCSDAGGAVGPAEQRVDDSQKCAGMEGAMMGGGVRA